MLLILLLKILGLASADVYLHSPRGSNNRLNEDKRNRRNANRLFDSQNNNRGGYNVGSDNSMYFYSGSIIPIEWTNQHSCSDPNNNCEIIIQYICSPNIRDGRETRTIPENNNGCRNKNCNTDKKYGLHEDNAYYQKCKSRQRNSMLFTADQKLRGRTARYTRQNPKGTRRGYECPEERDYYPYWGPSPWKDIVVLTGDTSRCEYYRKESQNVKPRFECVVYSRRMKDRLRRSGVPNSKEGCDRLGQSARWIEVPAHNIPPPDCRKAPWSVDNHNGNGMGGYPNMYNWTAPDIDEDNCALRMRYNISTNDFNSWSADASLNKKNRRTKRTEVDIAELMNMESGEAQRRGYVFKNNPVVNAMAGRLGKKLKVRLAINTAQYGRTFQDRSHAFSIRKRPQSLQGKNIYNVNVRGKRGNIVQVYPAVEYDFVPNVLTVKKDDYVHFQWTGSNRNPRNNDGEGRRGTDRSNVVLLAETKNTEGSESKSAYPNGKHGHWGSSYPAQLDGTNLLGYSYIDRKRLALASAGTSRSRGNKNFKSSYFDLGPLGVTKIGTYLYMCTRNNNFSNRSQKGKIIVQS